MSYAFPRLAEGLLIQRGYDVFTAHGHGRSLGMRSAIFTRELPGILDCQLWPALESYVAARRLSPAPRVALVTDVGNDLLYQVPLTQVIGWLNECLDRLGSLGFETVVTALPMSSVLAMGAFRFTVAKGLLFPDCCMSWGDVLAASSELDEAVRKTAGCRGLEIVVPPSKWYSADSIHIRQAKQRRAFEAMCSRWKSIPPVRFGRFPWDRAHYWWNKHPHLRWIRRSTRIQPQPVWYGPSGNVLQMY